MKIFIIACGANKKAEAAPAADLYIGPMFSATLAYARSQVADEFIFILSAKHGLLALDTVIEPYNVTWGYLHRFQAITKEKLADQIPAEWENADWTVLAGEEYASRLHYAAQSRFAHPITFTRPLRGLAIGFQKKWLKDHTPQAAEKP